jgi:hypothetical protein
MPIAAGTRFGPYEIISAAGAGGMGEVYRAKDTRLDRIVAVKVLHPDLANNPEKRQRFELEARSISMLSHPHICTLHDIGHQDGVDYLVLEYLDGETLEKKLEKGWLPTREVLEYAIALADALDKAHRQGIIHRDIKPGNIMITKSGVKLMDFGLAKLKSHTAPMADALTEMTSDKKLTTEGTILGTFQYMAPEQLEGREADTRTDIFAFGEVLYEMATGKPAFYGRTKASLIAAILSTEPAEISSLQPASPPALNRIVQACLAKDPADRLQTAHDLKLQLLLLAELGLPGAAPALARAGGRKWAALAWSLAAILPLLAIAVTWSYFRSHQTAPARVLAFVPAPEGATIELEGDSAGPPVISPDGRHLAFVAAAGGKRQIWLRAMDSPSAQVLPDTDGGSFPFWSPDSRSIAFFANRTLKRLDLTGGSSLSLCEAPSGRGGAWGKGGVIIFAPEFRTGLFRVSASGGVPVPVTTVDRSKHSSHRWPFFLPDGQHFLYLAVTHGSPKGPNSAVYVSSIDGKQNQMLVRSVANPGYASGYLLSMRENTLMAQRFDPDRLRLDDEAFVVATGVRNDISTWHGAFDASGILLAYVVGKYTKSRLIWLDRSGKEIGTLASADFWIGYFKGFRISPQADRVAVEVGDPPDIWIYNISRGVGTRFTFNTGIEQLPVWSPDGSQIIFSSDQHGHSDLYRKATNGSGSEELLLESDRIKEPQDYSPDGRYLLYAQEGDIWALPLFGERRPFPIVQSPFTESLAAFSPDGRWVAYSSDESGSTEVYVVPFSPPGSGAAANSSRGGKWQVSTSGGVLPFWRRDGKELLYTDLAETSVMSAEVSITGSEFKIGPVRLLFKLPRQVGIDMVSDGGRFLMRAPGQEPPGPVTVVTSWTSGLGQK